MTIEEFQNKCKEYSVKGTIAVLPDSGIVMMSIRKSNWTCSVDMSEEDIATYKALGRDPFESVLNHLKRMMEARCNSDVR